MQRYSNETLIGEIDNVFFDFVLFFPLCGYQQQAVNRNYKIIYNLID